MKPQEKTTLRITYNTSGRPGAFRKNISIATDVSGQQEVEIEMVGTVKEAPGAKMLVTPRKVDAGSIQQGSSKIVTLVIKNEGTLRLIIKKIFDKGSNMVYFDGTRQGNIEIEVGQSRLVDIDFKPSQSGLFTDVIIIDSNAKNAPRGGFAVMIIGKNEK